MFAIFIEKLLPAFVGDHDFEGCINEYSCQKELFRHSNRTEEPHSGAVYGTSNLQNRLEKCVFPVYGPSLEALFALCVLLHAFLITFSHFGNAFVILSLKTGPRSRKSNRTDM